MPRRGCAGQWTQAELLLNCSCTAKLMLQHRLLKIQAISVLILLHGWPGARMPLASPIEGIATPMDSPKGFLSSFAFGPFEADLASGELRKTALASRSRTCRCA